MTEIKASTILLLGICLGIIVVGSLYIGGYATCKAGDGLMVKEGAIKWKCIQVEVLGACIFEDKTVIPSNQIGLYKYMDEQGDLSEEVFIRDENKSFKVTANFI